MAFEDHEKVTRVLIRSTVLLRSKKSIGKMVSTDNR